MTIRIDDVLGFLVADTVTPSSFGAQLERLRFGLASTPDPHQAREDAESNILRQAELLRAIDDFKAVSEFRPTSARGSGYNTLEKIQRATQPRQNQGAIALQILRAYQQWGTQSQERALVAVYGYVRSVAEKVIAPIPATDAVAATQLFREGKAQRARTRAAEAYADALLALGAFLNTRRRRKKQ